MGEVVVVIPARYASTRYPAKPLAKLKGANGTVRSLLERSVMAARRAAEEYGDGMSLFVATDDDRIAVEAHRIGANVIITSETCRNGTERVAEAIEKAGLSPEIIINLQGDAPLTPPHFIAALVRVMREDASIKVATPVLRCDEEAVNNFMEDRRSGRVGATTVVSSRFCRALYFSKEVIPFTAGRRLADGEVPIFHHVGLYAYRQEALSDYARWEMGPLEKVEGLEQLRFLENGCSVTTVEVSAESGATFWELNNPSDTALIEHYLAKHGID